MAGSTHSVDTNFQVAILMLQESVRIAQFGTSLTIIALHNAKYNDEIGCDRQ